MTPETATRFEETLALAAVEALGEDAGLGAITNWVAEAKATPAALGIAAAIADDKSRAHKTLAKALAGTEADYLADVVMTTLTEYYEGSSVEPLEETGLRENMVRDLYEALRSK